MQGLRCLRGHLVIKCLTLIHFFFIIILQVGDNLARLQEKQGSTREIFMIRGFTRCWYVCVCFNSCFMCTFTMFDEDMLHNLVVITLFACIIMKFIQCSFKIYDMSSVWNCPL